MLHLLTAPLNPVSADEREPRNYSTMSSQEEIDPSIFGDTVKKGAKGMIHFDSVDDVLTSFSQKSHSGREIRYPKKLSPIESLPVELIQHIFVETDLASLLALKRVNKRMAECIDTLPGLCEILQHCPQLLKAIGQTKMTPHYSITTLRGILRSDRCEFCHAYGPYLHLLRRSRCCYRCINTEGRLASISKTRAVERFALSPAEADSLITMHALPSVYDGDIGRQEPLLQRKYLVNQYAAGKISPSADARSRSNLHYSPADVRLAKNTCFIVCIAVPTIRNEGQQCIVEHGVWCQGCADTHSGMTRRNSSGPRLALSYEAANTAYSVRDFKAHARKCPGVQRLMDRHFPRASMSNN